MRAEPGATAEELIPLGLTTSREGRPAEVAEARAAAEQLGAPYIERRGRPTAGLLRDEGLAALLAIQQPQPVWCDRAGRRLVWHPNMAVGRLRAMRAGATDRLVAAGGIRPGDRVLDATLGLGADAIVLAAAAGEAGEVTGCEASPLVAWLTARGLSTYEHPLSAPMRRVRVIAGDHAELLAAGPPTPRWEVVYFDPMFDRPLPGSHGLDGLRAAAREGIPSAETVARARALSTRAVVLKARRGDPRPARLGGGECREGSGPTVYWVFEPLGEGDVAVG